MQAEKPVECKLLAEDYMECLNHAKEVLIKRNISTFANICPEETHKDGGEGDATAVTVRGCRSGDAVAWWIAVTKRRTTTRG